MAARLAGGTRGMDPVQSHRNGTGRERVEGVASPSAIARQRDVPVVVVYTDEGWATKAVGIVSETGTANHDFQRRAAHSLGRPHS